MCTTASSAVMPLCMQKSATSTGALACVVVRGTGVRVKDARATKLRSERAPSPKQRCTGRRFEGKAPTTAGTARPTQRRGLPPEPRDAVQGDRASLGLRRRRGARRAPTAARAVRSFPKRHLLFRRLDEVHKHLPGQVEKSLDDILRRVRAIAVRPVLRRGGGGQSAGAMSTEGESHDSMAGGCQTRAEPRQRAGTRSTSSGAVAATPNLRAR